MLAAPAAVAASAVVAVGLAPVQLQVAAEPLRPQPQAVVDQLVPVQRPVVAALRVRARRPVEAVSAAVPVELLLSHQSFSAAMARSTT
jgi:hypothetical protein